MAIQGVRRTVERFYKLHIRSLVVKAQVSVSQEQQERIVKWIVPFVLRQQFREVSILLEVIFARLRARREIDRDTIRFALRILGKNKSSRTLNAIRMALAPHHRLSKATENLRSLRAALMHKEYQRRSTEVDLGDLKERLELVCNSIAQEFGYHYAPPIEFFGQAEPNDFRASTDGSTVFLPQTLALAHVTIDGTFRHDLSTRLNEAFALLLGAHECLHHMLGSFDLNLDSPEGSRIVGMFTKEQRDRAQSLKARMESRWRASLMLDTELSEKLRDYLRRIRVDASDWSPTPKNGYLPWYFKCSTLARDVFNCFEDRRIKNWLLRNRPILAEVEERMLSYLRRDLEPSGELRLDADRFRHAVFLRILGVAHRPRIDALQWKRPYANVLRAVHKFEALESPNVLDSAKATIRVMRAIEPLSDHFAENDSLGNARNALHQISHDVTFRIASHERNSPEDSIDDQLEGSRGSDDDIQDDVNTDEECFVYPEFNGRILVERAARLLEFPYEPDLLGSDTRQLDPLMLEVSSRGSKSDWRKRSRATTHASYGLMIDHDRLSDWIAARRAGAEFPIFVRPREQSLQRDRHLIVVLDASVSMEVPLSIDGDSRFSRGLRLIDWLSQASRDLGFSLSLFLGLDCGRKDVRLYRIAPEWYRQLRPLAFGGFRAGAIVRHLDARFGHQDQERAAFLLISDGALGYMHSDDELQRRSLMVQNTQCGRCDLRQRCRNEPTTHVPMNSILERGIWKSIEYQLDDLGHAMENARSYAHLLVMSHHAPSDFLDDRLHDRWTNGTTDLGLSEATGRLFSALNDR